MTNNGKNGRKRRRRIILCIIILLVLVGAAIGVTAALRRNHQIDPAKLATVERGDIARSVVATGKVQPLAKVEVKSKASGIVKQIFVDYGDRVKAGQVLVELDKEALRASVREARATLQATQAAQEAAEATYERNVVEAEGPDMPFLKASMGRAHQLDRKSTRLNSSHLVISYAVFCLKKKNKLDISTPMVASTIEYCAQQQLQRRA